MTIPTFTHRHRVRLAETDAAGVLFFTQSLAITHLAYEALLDELGFSIGAMLREGRGGLPIVEASTQLLAPLRVGDDVEVAIALERLGERSFALSTTLTVSPPSPSSSSSQRMVGRCRTVHVCVDRMGVSTSLPPALSSALRARLPQVCVPEVSSAQG